ncbi:hypothetical protein [Mucilaginibacter sp. L3T2-6]|uniref:hypothetical protein n=1 Tax=Mucilaginibacter sp. L3T2-6 TaxID=3062491 RepID=UPI0026743D94|nr:hypothetical protein [Mucilaginibacter sp. L3T2-6]MDO3644450.1 hypothetical protein [Mucilaginibacter sp. L3T2-6]MDV6216902.1 hypothetical protein [Mucilaginibacter sp. L3T2-6]
MTLIPLNKMKEYNFEYTKQGIAYALFFASFAIIAISSIALGRLMSNYVLLDIIFPIIIGVVFFLLNKQRIKKTGKASLSDKEAVIELSDTETLSFDTLKYYYSYNGKNGIVFTLGLSDGTKFKMSANNNFCDVKPLQLFLTDLESAIESYNTQSQAGIVHLTSILARKNAVYILLILTILIIAGYIYTKMPLMCIPIGFTLPVIINWIQYFQLRAANKLVDF